MVVIMLLTGIMHISCLTLLYPYNSSAAHWCTQADNVIYCSRVECFAHG